MAPTRFALMLTGVLCAAGTAQAQSSYSYSVLHQFSISDGGLPYGDLFADEDGNFYGTTDVGGATNAGTFFQLTPGGTYTVLSSFTLANGGAPYGGAVEGKDGNFYGVTLYGGANSAGAAYQVTPTGQFTTLHSFDRPDANYTNTEGANPNARLTLGTDGNFYGAAMYGGANNTGTLFSMTAAGSVTVLHTFSAGALGNSDGANPASSLVQASDGNFYGATLNGGPAGTGTVFRLSPQGTFTTLHSFAAKGSGNTDGVNPSAGLIQATDGFLYGSTAYGGINNTGTIFKISLSGGFSTLHSFAAKNGKKNLDGIFPSGRLLQGSDGSFYGVSALGGSNGYGTVFRTTNTGATTSIYNFTAPTNKLGGLPFAGLVEDSSGNLYGSTVEGGTSSEGVLYKLTPLPLPVISISINPTSLALGQTATITWSTSNANTCTSSGAWSGNRALAASMKVTPTVTGANVYTINCKGSGGSNSASVTLNVSP